MGDPEDARDGEGPVNAQRDADMCLLPLLGHRQVVEARDPVLRLLCERAHLPQPGGVKHHDGHGFTALCASRSQRRTSTPAVSPVALLTTTSISISSSVIRTLYWRVRVSRSSMSLGFIGATSATVIPRSRARSTMLRVPLSPGNATTSSGSSLA